MENRYVKNLVKMKFTTNPLTLRFGVPSKINPFGVTPNQSIGAQLKGMINGTMVPVVNVLSKD